MPSARCTGSPRDCASSTIPASGSTPSASMPCSRKRGDELAAAAAEVEHRLVRLEQREVPLLERRRAPWRSRRGTGPRSRRSRTRSTDPLGGGRRGPVRRRLPAPRGGRRGRRVRGRGPQPAVERVHALAQLGEPLGHADEAGAGRDRLPELLERVVERLELALHELEVDLEPGDAGRVASRVRRASSGSRSSRSAATSACITLPRDEQLAVLAVEPVLEQVGDANREAVERGIGDGLRRALHRVLPSRARRFGRGFRLGGHRLQRGRRRGLSLAGRARSRRARRRGHGSSSVAGAILGMLRGDGSMRRASRAHLAVRSG